MSLLDNLRKRAAEQGLTGVGSLMPDEEPTEVPGVPDDDPWLFAVDRRRQASEFDVDDREAPAAERPPVRPSMDSFEEQPIDTPDVDEQVDATLHGGRAIDVPPRDDDPVDATPFGGELIDAPPRREGLIEAPPLGEELSGGELTGNSPIDDPFSGMRYDSIGGEAGIDGALFPSEVPVPGEVPAPAEVAGAGLFDSVAEHGDVEEAMAFPDMDMVYAGLSDEGITPIDSTPDGRPIRGSDTSNHDRHGTDRPRSGRPAGRARPPDRCHMVRRGRRSSSPPGLRAGSRVGGPYDSTP